MFALLRTLFFLLGVVLYLVAAWPLHLYFLFSRNEARRQRLLFGVVSAWARCCLWLAGARVRVEGLEHMPPGGVMLMSNHQGNFDIMVLLGHCGRVFGFVAKASVQYIPLLGGWMRRIRCVNIQRKERGQALRQLMAASAGTLQAGHALCIFPEGTRSRGGPVADFKRGGFRAAVAAGVPILPIALEGSYNLYEAHRPWVRPAEVRMRILPPVSTEGCDEKDLPELMERVRSAIVAAQAELRRDAASGGR
ncbi:MAG: 1-acyl-sn-glycerol-3-phosphate acyltransferase [Clostridiales bacterium]|nr:1-acyl-sn-glycerol-3-phosphate acyltransferase [Clostridiales bacterium]